METESTKERTEPKSDRKLEASKKNGDSQKDVAAASPESSDGHAHDHGKPVDRDDSPHVAHEHEKNLGPKKQKELFGHPVGLYVLFFTEMWERFSFYGMRGLLKGYMMYFLFVTVRQTLYVPEGAEGVTVPTLAGDPHATMGWGFMQNALLWIDPKMDLQGQASMIYGLYNGLVYLTPVVGGYLADKYFGQRKIVVAGALLMALGEFMMMSGQLFFFALIVLIIGNGAFKPNISTQVGNLYPEGDKRRDRAYSIFYVGINLGSFICNLICGTLAALYGWKWGFFAAGVGLLAGLVGYVAGQNYLAPDNKMKTKADGKPAEKKPLTKQEKMVVISLIVLCALNVPFWAVYEQQGNTMQTWADNQTIWPKLGSFQVPSSWFQSFNPLMIMVFTPLVNWFWEWQARRKKEPTTVSKMAIGSLILGLSFIFMVVGARLIGEGKGSVFWPFAATAILTIGELYLSPIGLSLVAKASPARMVSLMMGMWFVSSFLGGFGSGVLGVFYTKMSRDGFFIMLMAIGVATAGAMWAFNKPLRKALGDNA